MTCDSPKCTGWARWRPTFLIYHKGHDDPLEAAMDMAVCDICLKRLVVHDFITDENWVLVCNALIAQGYPRPIRDRTLLDWQLIDDETSLH